MSTIQIPVKNKNLAPNQVIITNNDGEFFQSYDSLIAAKLNNGKVLLDEKYWKFSQTTSKYRSQFLGEDTKTTLKKIEDGTYVLLDLNTKK